MNTDAYNKIRKEYSDQLKERSYDVEDDKFAKKLIKVFIPEKSTEQATRIVQELGKEEVHKDTKGIVEYLRSTQSSSQVEDTTSQALIPQNISYWSQGEISLVIGCCDLKRNKKRQFVRK